MIRKLEYRSPRTKAHFVIEFATGDVVIRGVCVDFNELGLRATLEKAIAVGTEGLLTLHRPSFKTIVPASVVYLLKEQVGFTFTADMVHENEVLRPFRGVLAS